MRNINLNILSLSKDIEILNEKLNSFFAEHLNSPWAGMAIFIVLMIFGFWAISGTGKK